jgi:hypothetical protein
MNQIKANLATFVQSISENVERIQKYDGKIPQIEIDILLESIRDFYTNVLELNKDNIGLGTSSSHIMVNTLHEQHEAEVEAKAQEIVTTAEAIATIEVAETVVAEKPVEQAKVETSEQEAPMVLETKKEEAEVVENEEESIVLNTDDDNSDTAFETLLKNETILQEIANDDILSSTSIIEFETVEYGQPVVEHTAVQIKEPVAPLQAKEEPVQEPVVEVEKEVKIEAKPAEPAPIVRPAIEPAATVVQDSAPKKVEQPKPIVPEPKVEESHDENRQTSLFDYLKSNSVTRAAEQVDRFSGVAVKTLADKFQESKEKEKILFEVAHEREPQKRRVEDLRTIIGINDKILFMSDLFGKNMKAYNDFILRLNKINDTQEALDYLRTVEEEYNWDKESLAVQSFIKIFERKFK